MRAEDVLDALRADYCGSPELLREGVQPEWAMVTEFRAWVDHPVAGASAWARNERSIDALLTRTFSSGRGFERLAVEVKVSRADYRNETPEKRAPAEVLAHRTAYAAPVGLIDPKTLPDGWGLIEVYEEPGSNPRSGKPAFGKRTAWRRTAWRRMPTHDMDGAFAMAARRAHKVTEQLRSGDGEAAEMARLRIAHDRLVGQLDRAERAVQRERSRRREAEHLLLAGEAQVCFYCATSLRPTYSPHREKWAHASKALDQECMEIRLRVRQLEREKDTGSAYLATFPAPIESRAERAARLADESEEWLR